MMCFKSIRFATAFIIKEDKCLRKCLKVAKHEGQTFISALLCMWSHVWKLFRPVPSFSLFQVLKNSLLTSQFVFLSEEAFDCIIWANFICLCIGFCLSQIIYLSRLLVLVHLFLPGHCSNLNPWTGGVISRYRVSL